MNNPERKFLLDDERVLGWGSVILVLAFWEITARLTGVNSLYLPRPSQIVVALIAMFQNGGLLYDLLMTLYRIFAGFGIALIIGTLLGVWIATSARTRAVADVWIGALYPLPKVTLIPLLIIWLGTGGTPSYSRKLPCSMSRSSIVCSCLAQDCSSFMNTGVSSCALRGFAVSSLRSH